MGAARSTVGMTALACVACLAFGSGPALAGVRIHMVDGGVLEALSCRFDARTVIIEVGEGATLGLPSSRIARVEPLEESGPVAAEPAPAVAPQPVPTPPPALPVTGPAQEPVSIDALIERAAARHHVEKDLLAAVIAVESGYRPDALSPRGARGLMQLMPATAKDLAVSDPFDAEQNIEAGARYLRRLLDQHGDSFVSALAAYNAGMGRVARYSGVPPYRETVEYISRVLKRYASPSTSATAPAGGGR